jgi:glutamyl/glutaminyl-tRNA synthetase
MINASLQQFHKTRIAPTPSGFLHLGNVLSFAITAALARKTGAKILLRIDDLDHERANKLYVQDIFDTLDFLEIPWDEGPRNLDEYETTYSQLHRMDRYQKALDQLRENHLIFACDCSRSQIRRNTTDDIYPGTCRQKNIPLDAKNICWRLLTDSREISINTLDAGPLTTSLPASMQDFVVRKKDGYPAYQLASVIDDLYYGIDLVIRGEDLWSSTIAQHYLALSLQETGFQQTTFYHHSLLMASAEKKLSKSAGATAVTYLRGQGKKSADIYEAIARMMGSKETATNWKQLAGLITAIS